MESLVFGNQGSAGIQWSNNLSVYLSAFVALSARLFVHIYVSICAPISGDIIFKAMNVDSAIIYTLQKTWTKFIVAKKKGNSWFPLVIHAEGLAWHA